MKKYQVALLTAILVAASVGTPLALFLKEERENGVVWAQEVDSLTQQLEEAKKSALSTAGLFYDLNGLEVTVEQNEVDFKDWFTAEALAQRAANCGETDQEATLEKFNNLVKEWEGVKGTEYRFEPTAASGSLMNPAEAYVVAVFPNAVKYENLEGLKQDFPTCEVGLTSPVRMNAQTIMFREACGAGYAETPELTCSDMEQKITLELQ